jgi:hypothetical protein
MTGFPALFHLLLQQAVTLLGRLPDGQQVLLGFLPRRLDLLVQVRHRQLVVRLPRGRWGVMMMMMMMVVVVVMGMEMGVGVMMTTTA